MIITNIFNKFTKMSFAFILAFAMIAANATYAPVVELDLKAGNKRGIGRIGSLIPIYSDDSFLTYSSIFVMKDTISGLEGNLGLGLRKIINNNYILGIYGFGDIRRSLNKKQAIFQVNFGAELFFEHLEIRMNTYFPLSKDVYLDKISTNIYSNYDVYSNQTTETRTSKDRYEILLKGYDLDVGGNIPNFTQLKAYGGFYHFFNKGISLVGSKFRAEYEIRHWLSVGGEVNYDTKRKWSNYADVKVKYSFDKKSRSKLTNLQKKMTLLPVRDVDVVTQEQEVDDEYFSQKTEGKTLYFVSGEPEEFQRKKINLSGNTIEYLDNEQGPSGIYSGDDLANIVLVDSTGKIQSTVTQDKTIDQKIQAKLKDIVLQKGLYINSSKVKSSMFKSVIRDINKDLAISTIKKARNSGNIDSKEMLDDGVPFTKLRNSGITIRNMLKEGIKPLTLKKEGVLAKSILDTRLVSPKKLKDIGYTVGQLKAANVSLNKLIQISKTSELLSHYTITELLGENVGIDDLRKANVDVNRIPNTVSPRKLLDGGYTEAQLLTKYDPVRIVRAGGDLDALRREGVESKELEALRNANELSVRQMIDTGNYSIEQLVNDPTIGVDDLKNANVQLNSISGYTSIKNSELISAGYKPDQIIAARNITYNDLIETDKISPQTLINNDVEINDLLDDEQITVSKLIEANIKVKDLKATNRPNILKEIIDADVGIRTLLNDNGGYTLDEIIVDDRITPKKLVDANVDINLLKERFTVTQLYANGDGASIATLRTVYQPQTLVDNIPLEALLNGDMPLRHLKRANVTAKAIWDADPTKRRKQLLKGGYSYSDMINSNITVVELLQNGATPKKFKTAANGTPEVTALALYNAKSGYGNLTTVGAIIEAGYNLSEDIQKRGVTIDKIFNRFIDEYKYKFKKLPTQAIVKDYLVTKGNITEGKINSRIRNYNDINRLKPLPVR